MPFEATLPAELWLIIFDMVLSTGITLIEQCDPISFTDIYACLHSPATRAPPFDNSYGQLRLVCRTFNALLGASPHYIMKSSRDSIPAGARAVYIMEARTPNSGYVGRLLEEPSICHRLIYLDTFSNHSRLSNIPTAFDLLCEHSQSLPNLRCLTLRFTMSANVHLQFWARLNDAFPLLRRLVIDVESSRRFMMRLGNNGEITFRNVEVLILGPNVTYFPGLHFPRLRHVALDLSYTVELEIVTGSPLLEWAIFSRIRPETLIDLKSFPRLRFLRLRTCDAAAILPAGEDHPLEHLWLYDRIEYYSPPGIQYILQVAERLPAVSRLTLEVTRERMAGVERELRKAGLKHLGLSLSLDDNHIVLKRTQMDPRMSDQPDSNKQRPFLSWVRSKFRQ